jgi:hypothetical protein
LDASEEDHSIGSPVLNGIRKDSGVHENAPCLALPDFSIFAPGAPEPEGGLAGVNTIAKQFEFEDGSDLTFAGRKESSKAKAALPNAVKPIAVPSEFILKRR